MHEQSRSREAVVVVREVAWVLFALDKFGDKIPKRFKHDLTVTRGHSFPRSYARVTRGMQARAPLREMPKRRQLKLFRSGGLGRGLLVDEFLQRYQIGLAGAKQRQFIHHDDFRREREF